MLTELLAPAGSYEILVVAINAGANAVYIAGRRYGARAFAHNFTSEELEKAVEYAHLNGAQVHITVNTLFHSDEILEVLKYTQFLYRIGVDAVIVQDLGLLYLLKRFLPDLNVHSSTQMTLRDYESLKWASENGVKRIILPRELNTKEIKQIHEKLEEDNIDLDLEAFGHGSLCYCISGDCYMSSYMHGRSANRGACSQPCRSQYKLKYKNKTISNGCLISTHDLATYKNLKEINDAGVKSLKIEGRLKSEDYVATVVKTYHTLMENMDEDIDADIFDELNQNMDLTFNRYYTNGYILDDAPGDVMGRESSYHQGLYLGDIVKIDGEEVTIKFNSPNHPVLINGDGIGFKNRGKIRGIYIDNILSQNDEEIVIKTTREVYIGNEVYISYSKQLHDSVKKYKKEQIQSHIPLSLDVSINSKDKVVINASFQVDNTNISYGYKSKEKIEQAQKRPITPELIEKQLQKTGNTPFYIKNIRTQIPENIFIPIGQINKIRRELIKKGKTLLLEHYKPNTQKAENKRTTIKQFIKKHKNTKQNKKTNYLGINIIINNIEQLKTINKYQINKIYYDPTYSYKNKKEFFNNLEKELEQAQNIAYDKEITLTLPNFTSDKDLKQIKKIINQLKEKNINITIQGDSPALPKIFNTTIYGSHTLNVWNNYTTKILSDTGFKALTISNEISKEEIKKLIQYNTTKCQMELIVFGNQEIMTTNDNFTKLNEGKQLNLETYEYALLEDKKHKYKFKILQDYNNRSHFFNTECLSLIDEIDEIKKLGIDNITLDCRFTSPNYLNKIVSLYMQRLEEENPQISYYEKIKGFSNSKLNKGNFTTGRRLEK